MLAAAIVTAALGAGGAPAQDADPVPVLRGRAATVAARRRVFGAANVNRRTGAIRHDRVILSWFGVSSFAMAIGGHVVLLDAWVARGRMSGYVPTTPAELAQLRPELIFIGHGHFDHAADATPLALATGARLVGTAEQCAALRTRVAGRRARCVAVFARGARPGSLASPRLLRGLRTRALKHLHSVGTPADGDSAPLAIAGETSTARRFPPTPRDAAALKRHLSDPEGGAVLYRFALGRFSLVWHDTVGPLVDRAPGVLRVLRRLGPVDVHVGAIQGFNMFTNGLRDPRTYIEALRPATFVSSHHDDWYAGALSMPAARYEQPLRAQLARIPAARRPRLRFLRDPRDYLRPERLTFPTG